MLVKNKIFSEKIADTIRCVISIALAVFFGLAILGFFLKPKEDGIPVVIMCFAVVVLCVASLISCSRRKKLRRGAWQIAEYMSERKSCSLRELACVLECDEETVRSTLEKILQRRYLSNINYDGQRGLLVAVGVASNAVTKRRCTTCGALLPDATAKCVHCGTRLRH